MHFGARSSWRRSRSFFHLRGGAADSFHDPGISTTAAEMAVHRLADVSLGWIDLLRQEFGCLDRNAVVAIAALRRLLLEKRLLNRMQFRRSGQAFCLRVESRQSLQRRDSAIYRGERRYARSDLTAIEKNGARAA